MTVEQETGTLVRQAADACKPYNLQTHTRCLSPKYPTLQADLAAPSFKRSHLRCLAAVDVPEEREDSAGVQHSRGGDVIAAADDRRVVFERRARLGERHRKAGQEGEKATKQKLRKIHSCVCVQQQAVRACHCCCSVLRQDQSRAQQVAVLWRGRGLWLRGGRVDTAARLTKRAGFGKELDIFESDHVYFFMDKNH